MKELSIFVDESGDFGEYSTHSPYYVISLVLHNQDVDISNDIKRLDNELKKLHIKDLCIHTEPLIRKEESYSNMLPNERRTIFTKLYYFAIKIDIKYKSFIYDKKQYKDLKLEERIVKDMNNFILDNNKFFNEYNKIILYYDNGQKNITKVLKEVLETNFYDYDIRKVLPKDYKLFQVADLMCTIELVNKKSEMNEMSKSEMLMFHSKKDFRKDFIKKLLGKRMS